MNLFIFAAYWMTWSELENNNVSKKPTIFFSRLQTNVSFLAICHYLCLLNVLTHVSTSCLSV